MLFDDTCDLKIEFLVIYCEKIELPFLGSFLKVSSAVNVLTSLCETKNKRKCQIKCEIKCNYLYTRIKNKVCDCMKLWIHSRSPFSNKLKSFQTSLQTNLNVQKTSKEHTPVLQPFAENDIYLLTFLILAFT